MTNPYETPRTIQQLSAVRYGVFEKIYRVQKRVFYLGLLIAIVGAIFVGSERFVAVGSVMLTLGTGMFFLAVLVILPMSVWEFIQGVREGCRKS